MPDSTPGQEDDGTFTPEADDDEILDAVAELEPAGTVDVGEAVGLARQNADYRLRQLRDEGRVEARKRAARAEGAARPVHTAVPAASAPATATTPIPSKT